MVTINTTDDLLKLLDENEDFLKAVRQRILTEELLALPARIEASEKENRAFRQEMREFQRDMLAFQQDTLAFQKEMREFQRDTLAFQKEMREFQQEMRAFVQTTERFIETTTAHIQGMQEVRNRVGALWGDRLEASMARKVYMRLSEDLGVRSLDVVSVDDFGSLTPYYEAYRPFYKRIEDAADAGIISEADERNIHRIDMIARTRLRGSDATIWLLVQAASVIKHDDITKARDGARVLEKVFGEETLAAVYGFEIDGANKELADNNQVTTMLVNPDNL